MEVYLVQHGESKSESEDPARSLTDKGWKDVESMSSHFAGLGIEVAQIFHSGKLRAKQTAEVFAQYLMPPRGIVEQEGIGPLDDPHKAKAIISQAEEPCMIVGHLPHLKKLASLLILGEPEKEVVNFRMGGVVCLTKSGESWSIEWALVPLLARQTGQRGSRKKRE